MYSDQSRRVVCVLFLSLQRKVGKSPVNSYMELITMLLNQSVEVKHCTQNVLARQENVSFFSIPV